MANLVKKHSIASGLAQKMVDAAVAKASELGVCENVVILDDGGNLKAFSRMDGAPIICIEMAQNKAYTALIGVSTQDFFRLHIQQTVAASRHPHAFACGGVGWRFPIKVGGEIVRAIRVSGAPHSAERRRLRDTGPGGWYEEFQFPVQGRENHVGSK